MPVPSGRFDPHGHEIPSGYRLEVDQEKADTVRRIFALCATGIGLRAIAHDLNRDSILAPRGRGWAPSALRGLLLNPIYRGEYVWDRSEWVKDHETGKRKRFERPESDWVRQHDEAWRVVSDQQWEAVQACFARRAREYTRAPGGRIVSTSAPAPRSHRHLLAGFLECGVCGGTFHAVNGREEFGCAWHRDRGEAVCASSLRVARLELEEHVLGAVRERILVPDVVAYAVEQALEIVRAQLRPTNVEADRARLIELEAKIERAVDLAIETGGIDAAKRKLAALEQERASLAARLERGVPRTPSIDELRPLIEARVVEMRRGLEADAAHGRSTFTALLDGSRMRVHPDTELVFRVEGLFHLALGDENAHRSQLADGRLGSVVAGGCNRATAESARAA